MLLKEVDSLKEHAKTSTDDLAVVRQALHDAETAAQQVHDDASSRDDASKSRVTALEAQMARNEAALNDANVAAQRLQDDASAQEAAIKSRVADLEAQLTQNETALNDANAAAQRLQDDSIRTRRCEQIACRRLRGTVNSERGRFTGGEYKASGKPPKGFEDQERVAGAKAAGFEKQIKALDEERQRIETASKSRDAELEEQKGRIVESDTLRATLQDNP